VSWALIAEPSLPISNALKKFLEATGYQVSIVHFADDALLEVRKLEPALVFAAVSDKLDGEGLCRKIKKLEPLCPVVLTYASNAEKIVERAQAAHADAWMTLPLKLPLVASTALAMSRIRELSQRAAALANVAAPNTHDLEFFKKFLTLEIKRSRRYQYPLAILMVAIDRLSERLAKAPDQETARAASRAESMQIAGQLLRDIDLCVPFDDDRLLVFLPHTARDGALTVASRLVAELQGLQTLPDATASAGVATYDPKVNPKAHVGFGSLMRDASVFLRAAQEAGGNRVEASAPSAPTKRNRISLA
jgi:PleD family two-component response regulator